MSRPRNVHSRSTWSLFVSSLALALATTATSQDEVLPEGDGAVDPPIQDEDPLDPYTFEGSGLRLFDPWRLDASPPAGISLTEETLPAGTWALRVRLSSQSLDGLKDGRDDVSSAQAFAAGYTLAPTSQRNDSAEIEVIHGFNDRWTVWGMLPVVNKELEVDISGGGTSTSESSGIGDVRVGANYLLHETEDQRVNIGFGLGIPTGEFDARDTYGGVSDALLPYSMQPGGGTFDIYPSAGWIQLFDGYSLGARAWGRVPIGKNSDDWSFSRELDVDFWAAHQLDDRLSVSARLNASWWGDVHGSAAALDPTNSPLDDAARQGGARVDAFAGFAWDLRGRDGVGANRLEIEVGVPIDERLDGPALSEEWVLRFGWKLGL